jgi:hypothetical protein
MLLDILEPFSLLPMLNDFKKIKQNSLYGDGNSAALIVREIKQFMQI